ncbi:MAG TPA: hypothetical protein VG028_09350 [Terriglobia bacterium]|nr:hypothetical protein [Terriglobia bacterium]
MNLLVSSGPEIEDNTFSRVLFEETALARMKYGSDVHMLREYPVEDYVGSVGNNQPAKSGLINLRSYIGKVSQHENSILNALDGILRSLGTQAGKENCDTVEVFKSLLTP